MLSKVFGNAFSRILVRELKPLVSFRSRVQEATTLIFDNLHDRLHKPLFQASIQRLVFFELFIYQSMQLTINRMCLWSAKDYIQQKRPVRYQSTTRTTRASVFVPINKPMTIAERLHDVDPKLTVWHTVSLLDWRWRKRPLSLVNPINDHCWKSLFHLICSGMIGLYKIKNESSKALVSCLIPECSTPKEKTTSFWFGLIVVADYSSELLDNMEGSDVALINLSSLMAEQGTHCR